MIKGLKLIFLVALIGCNNAEDNNAEDNNARVQNLDVPFNYCTTSAQKKIKLKDWKGALEVYQRCLQNSRDHNDSTDVFLGMFFPLINEERFEDALEILPYMYDNTPSVNAEIWIEYDKSLLYSRWKKYGKSLLHGLRAKKMIERDNSNFDYSFLSHSVNSNLSIAYVKLSKYKEFLNHFKSLPDAHRKDSILFDEQVMSLTDVAKRIGNSRE